MFRKLLVIFFLIALASCSQKETPKVKSTRPKVIKRESLEGKILPIDTSLFTKFESKVLRDFYATFNNETVWQSEKNRKLILEEFRNAENEGLSPDDYRVKKLSTFEKKFTRLNDKQLVEYDLLLTYNLQKYVWHVSQGKVNPKSLYNDWDLPQKNTDVNTILIKAYNQNTITKSLDSCKPQHIVYRKLKNALQLINSFPKDTVTKIEVSQKIMPNDTLDQILAIKQRLIYWRDMKPSDSLTKIYDKETVKAVKEFQFRHGLAADGVIGQSTIAALNFSKNARKKQIIANLERWKWFPKDLGETYVIVNIPEYKLRLVKDKDTIQKHKVIVGTLKRKTPILTSKLTSAVLNPTWTVPPTILKEDLIPATIKDRNYLASKNITVYDLNGDIVSAENWNPKKANSYRYVQSPGTNNSLGIVKILFPNRFTVYLHDTNHRNYFEKYNRSLSSGCVRVQNPLELTTKILNDSINYDLEKINEIIKTGETKNIKIKDSIFVHQWYWTAWSNDDKLIFRNDIYNLDDALYQKIKE